MITDGRSFDTNAFFTGGAGMFIQYHDIVKPVYLYAIIKMLLTKTSFGIPLDIIDKMSIFSLEEWYVKRRYINPLRCLDYQNILDPNELDELLQKILSEDDSLYKLSPGLNIQLMMEVYKRQHMSFPIYVYSQKEEPHIAEDCKQVFSGINVTYLYGEVSDAIKKCDQNFTYILSDVELLKQCATILDGVYAHILLAVEYRYNYIDNCKTFKYNLTNIGRAHPSIRIGTTVAGNRHNLISNFKNLIMNRGES